MKRQLFVISLIVPMVALLWVASAEASGFGRFAGPSNGGLIRSYAVRVALPAPKVPGAAEKTQASASQPAPSLEIDAKKSSLQPVKAAAVNVKRVRPAQKRSLPPLERWLAEQLGAFPAMIPALL